MRPDDPATRNAAVDIRPVGSAGDLACVTELFQAYASALGVDLAFQGFAAELAALPGCYAPPAGVLLLARDPAGRPAGCVGLRPILPEGCCEMKRLYVRPEGRGSGIGKALADAVIGEARRIGYREMRLETLPSLIGAMALYGKSGFHPIAPYYDTPLAGTVFLARSLA